MENLLRVWQWSDEFEWRAGETFMSSPLAPLTGVVVYLTVIAVLRWLMSFRSKPIPGLRPFLVLHNLLLCLYSAMSVVVVVHEVWRYQSQGVPLFDLFCDQNNDYSRGRLYFMTYLFYLSKYYELLDTLFIVLKKVRREPHVYRPTYTRTLLFFIVYSHVRVSNERCISLSIPAHTAVAATGQPDLAARVPPLHHDARMLGWLLHCHDLPMVRLACVRALLRTRC
mgnify:FL=1